MTILPLSHILVVFDFSWNKDTTLWRSCMNNRIGLVHIATLSVRRVHLLLSRQVDSLATRLVAPEFGFSLCSTLTSTLSD